MCKSANFVACWASAFMGLALIFPNSGCTSSCSPSKKAPAEFPENICLDNQPHEPSFSGLFFEGCPKSPEAGRPELYAHFLENSYSEEFDLKDLVTNKSASFSCAPGPFTAARHSLEQDIWALKRMPDYFVWPTIGMSPSEEQFYITNQNGLPIKSSIVTIERGTRRAAVLRPQASLKNQEKYYIYQVLIQGEERTTWVQPLNAAVEI